MSVEPEEDKGRDLREAAEKALRWGRSAASKTADAVGEVKERVDDHLQLEPVDIETAEPTDLRKAAEALGDQQFTMAVAIGSMLCARVIADNTDEDDRKKKMGRVIDRRRVVLIATSGLDEASDAQLAALLVTITEDWDRGDRIRFLIELDFGDPFAPYSLKHSTRQRRRAVASVARLIGAADERIDEIDETIKEAANAHHKLSLGRLMLYGGAAAAAFGLLGFMAAPVLGAALGGAAGLSGAAAAAHGLALLGGGSLAAGGAGVAGGMWLVTGAGAAAGLVGAGGGTALYQLGVAQAEAELVKLQVTFKLTVLDARVDTIKAQEVIGGLQRQATELREALVEERRMNDDNSSRVKDLEAKIEAVENSLGWMQDEVAAA